MTMTPTPVSASRLRPMAALLALGLLPLAAHAQGGDADLERTPRGAVQAYLEACRQGDFGAAGRLLSPEGVPEDGDPAELAEQFKVVLDQKLWISLDELSDEPEGRSDDGLAQRDLVGRIETAQGSVAVFVERYGAEPEARWRFSPGTVAQIPALYEQFGYGPLAEILPRVLLETRFLEVRLWQWGALFLLLIAAWFLAWTVASLLVRLVRPLTRRSKTEFDDRLLELTVGPLRFLITVAVFVLGSRFMGLSQPAQRVLDGVAELLAIFGVAWLLFRGLDLISGHVDRLMRTRGQVGAANLLPLGMRALKAAVGVMAVLAALDSFGFEVTTLIAGLGVGGLAVALAAQKTLENIFGGVTVLMDQPVRPGEFCRFGEKVGTVEEVGLRSTRVRTLDRTVISVPNADFSTMQIENFAKRDRMRLVTTIGLRYETSPDQLRHVLSGLRAMLHAHPKVIPEPARARFVGFGACSLDIEIFTYVASTDFNEFLGVREDIYLRVMDVVAASGTGFAFPSQTLYMARDGGLDQERTASAEAQVAEWRAQSQLAFPDHSSEQIRALDDSLDWPPRGSVAGAKG